MIQFVSGDILLTRADAIAHGVAPMDDFKQGLALSLRERWPGMYKDFRHFCHQETPREGSLWSWKGPGGPIIVNLLTQEAPATKDGHPGRASIKYVNSALKELTKEIKKLELQSLALTKLATGVGGLDWSEVKPLIELALGEFNIPIYVYEKFEKNTEAQEG